MKNLISVLVVEDDAAMYGIVQEVLTVSKPRGWRTRYKTENATTLEEAMAEAKKNWDVIILDLSLLNSKGASTFHEVYKVAKAPIIVFTGNDTDGLFDELLDAGAYRCYNKLELVHCMSMLHHVIRHVVHEHAKNKLIAQQEDTISGRLKSVIRACAGCGRYFDELVNRWVPRDIYFKHRNIIESHGNCEDCTKEYYAESIQEATKDYK